MKNKKLVLIIFLFLIIISVFITRNIFLNKEVEKVTETNKINKKQFAMYVKKSNDGEYETYTDSDLFPDSSMYIFNAENSYCIDNKDTLIENAISYTNGKVTVTSGITIFCYLYFDIIKDDISITLKKDGISSSVPTNGLYKKYVNCDSGNVSYNKLYQRLEIGTFTTGTTCTLEYMTDETSYEKLIDVVQNVIQTNDYGYRYSGKNPDNYIWFNNELWRIIGLLPTCTSASSGTCSETTNLVKIIRNESIGTLSYDAKTSGYTGKWGSNTLYQLLNNYYYGKKDGYGSGYCFSRNTTAIIKCDYTDIGISSEENDYYGQMIEDVYWYIGSSANDVMRYKAYGNETSKVETSLSKIGLMSASDYGYAAGESGYGVKLNAYNTKAITSSNWLFKSAYIWTTTQYASDTSVVLISGVDGHIGIDANDGAGFGGIVYPSLYLNANVYKISGSGTILDPYIIGM